MTTQKKPGTCEVACLISDRFDAKAPGTDRGRILIINYSSLGSELRDTDKRLTGF